MITIISFELWTLWYVTFMNYELHKFLECCLW